MVERLDHDADEKIQEEQRDDEHESHCVERPDEQVVVQNWHLIHSLRVYRAPQHFGPAFSTCD